MAIRAARRRRRCQLPASRHHIEVRKEGFNAVRHRPGARAGHRAHASTSSWSIRRTWSAIRRRRITTKSGIKLLDRRRRHVPGGHRPPRAGPASQRRRAQGDAGCGRSTWANARSPTRSSASSVPTHNSGADRQRLAGSRQAARCRASPGTKPRSSATGCRRRKACRRRTSRRRGRQFQLIVPVSNGYRLPTEGEWEFVARAASTGKPLKYPWGKDLPVVSGTANFAGSEAFEPVRHGHRRAHATNSRRWPRRRCSRRIALGFYDLAGNVSGVGQRSLPVIHVPPRAVTDPLGPTDGKSHAYRGSNWRTASYRRAAFPLARRRRRGHATSSASASRATSRPNRTKRTMTSCVICSSVCSRSAWRRSPPSPRPRRCSTRRCSIRCRR